MYVAIDLKSFYASVECRDRELDPLKANLVVADASRTEKTICLAVSPALKKYGIPGRARLFEVYQKLQEIERQTGKEIPFEIATPRMARYMEVSTQIYNCYLQFVSADDIHVYSIDEVFIDVTDYLKLYQISAKELAKRMINAVLKETGITATAGLGTNLYLAKIAMDIEAKHTEADSDGTRIAFLDEKRYRERLWSHTPLTDFWRVGKGIARKLNQSGMYTMGDVARVSVHDEDILYKLFGIDAEILIDHAWGYEPCGMKEIKSYKSDSNCISSGQVLSEPYEFKKARIIVQEMVDLLVLDLVDKELMTDNLTLTVGYDRCSVDNGQYDGEVQVDFYGRIVPKPAHGTANLGAFSSSTQRIMGAVLELYDRIVDPNLFARRITISANHVKQGEYEQLDLFTDPAKREREKRLQGAMLSIQKKYGKNAILKGTNLQEGATTIERNSQIGGHKA